jgi:hypothetical protein
VRRGASGRVALKRARGDMFGVVVRMYELE